MVTVPYHRNRTVTKRWGITNQKQRTLGPESPGWEGNVKGGGGSRQSSPGKALVNRRRRERDMLLRLALTEGNDEM